MSNGCDAAREEVYFYLDGEQLGWYRRLIIKQHLRKCRNCEGAYQFEARFMRLVRRKAVDPAPEELISRLRTFLQEQEPDELER